RAPARQPFERLSRWRSTAGDPGTYLLPIHQLLRIWLGQRQVVARLDPVLDFHFAARLLADRNRLLFELAGIASPDIDVHFVVVEIVAENTTGRGYQRI